MTVTKVLASQVFEGDVLTDAEGRSERIVVEVDRFSNAHGLIIFRTGRRGKVTGSTTASPDTILHVFR